MSDSPWARRGRQHSACCTCDPDTLETPWKPQLCAILHARDPAQASDLLDQFMQQEEGSIRRVLARVRRAARLSSEDDGVALSYLGQALMKMIHHRWRAKDGSGTSRVFDDSRNLPTILEAETRNCLRDDRRNGLLDGTGETPGSSAHDRRKALVRRSEWLFELEFQVRPDDEELVKFHNERMRATRRDPGRQSVLITKSDLRPVQSVPLDAPGLSTDSRLSTIDEPDLGAGERSARIAGVITRCEQLDAARERERHRRLRREPVLLAEVARAYFARHLAGDLPTRRELIGQLGITEPAARRELTVRLETILDLAREAFDEYLHDQ